MSEVANTQMGFGYQSDTDESLVGKGGDFGKFGLNVGAKMIKFEYNANGGAGGTPGDCIDLSIQSGEKEYRTRFFPVTRVFGKKNEVLTDVKSEAYIKAFNTEQAHLTGCITHILKCFVSEEAIKTALNVPIGSFAQFAQIVQSLVPAGSQNVDLDIFLHYQWEIGADNDKTYLELPKKMNGGYWMCKSMPGTFTENRDGGGLKYVNETGIEHMFARNSGYMEGNRANQAVESASDGNAIAGTAAPATSNW